MKKYMLVVAVTLLAQMGQAQTWDEWFRQKKTQRKYLLQQIAALQVHLRYVKQGYDIAKVGLTTIRSIKDGDFHLHEDFFNALKTVNPSIRNSAKVAQIIAQQIRIVNHARITLSRIAESGQFTPVEIAYCHRVWENLLDDCARHGEALLSVISSGELEMKDDERLKEIDRIHLEMQSLFTSCASLSEELAVLAIQRMGEQREINRSKLLIGLP